MGDQLSDEIQGPMAVIPIVPASKFIFSTTKTTTGSSTMVTTAADKDTYITAVQLSYSKDVACDVAIGSVFVSCVVDGVTKGIIALAILTLTAESDSAAIAFQVPIKVDRNTSIIIGTNTYTAGLMSRCAVIHGYTEEVTRT